MSGIKSGYDKYARVRVKALLIIVPPLGLFTTTVLTKITTVLFFAMTVLLNALCPLRVCSTLAPFAIRFSSNRPPIVLRLPSTLALIPL